MRFANVISSRSRCFPCICPACCSLAALTLVLMLAGCKPETADEAPPPPRPVRTVVVEKGGLGQSIVLTGQIQAEKEVALAFRIGGRIIERAVDAGDRVTPDQVVAKLDPQNELNTLRSARAALSAAKARLEQDSNHFDRQDTLLQARLDDPRQFRSGPASAAHGAGDGGRRQGPSRNRRGPRQLYPAQGWVDRHDHPPRCGIRRGSAGRSDGVHGRARFRLGRRLRRSGSSVAHWLQETPM